MAKIRYLTDLGWPGKIDLVFAVKTERDIIFRDELDSLRRRFPNLHVTVTLSQDEGTTWSGERGRISAELLHRVIPRISEQRVHVCGPSQMMDSTRGNVARSRLGHGSDQGRIIQAIRGLPPKRSRPCRPPETFPARSSRRTEPWARSR